MPVSDGHMPVELDGALAVIQWKREFARQLSREAAKIAKSSGAVVLCVDHYRRAVPAAMQSTLSFIAEFLDQERPDRVEERAA